MNEAMQRMFDSLVDDEVELTVKLHSDLQPIGPGRIETIPWTNAKTGSYTKAYKLAQVADLQTPSGPVRVTVPIWFESANVVWFSEGPMDADGKPVSMKTRTPQVNGGRTASGLHVPGRG